MALFNSVHLIVLKRVLGRKKRTLATGMIFPVTSNFNSGLPFIFQ